jgi:hypothetical protein
MKSGANPMSAIAVEFPSELIEEIDKLAGGEANRTNFLVGLVRDQISRQDQIAAIQAAAGAWTEDENAEWFGMDSAQYVDMIRSRHRQMYELEKAQRREP